MSIYAQFQAISAKLDREELATKKISQMSPEELREYRKLHPLKGRGKSKTSHHNPLAPSKPKAPPAAAPKAKMPKAAAPAKVKDKAPPAPKTHVAPAKELTKKPVAHKGETPHEPRKNATATPVAEHKEPKRGSLGHHESVDYVGKTLGFNRKSTPSPYNDTDDVTHEAEGDRTKDLKAHFKKLGYKSQPSQKYGDVETHVMQHPHDYHMVTFVHHPASEGGVGKTVMR